MKNLPTVVDYLESKGFKFKQEGKLFVTYSPFQSEKTPSFKVYPSGLFKDYSTGKSGNVLSLIKFFGDNINSLSSVRSVWVPPIEKPTKAWSGIPSRYLDLTPEETQSAQQYATTRCVHSHYHPAVTFHQKDGQFVRSGPALLFPHQDHTGRITGGKFRFVEPWNGQRFTSRGKLGFFVLEHLIESFETPILYTIEGEINALSLHYYFIGIDRPHVILSVGGVSSVPRQLPDRYKHLPGNLLIDYDGSEQKYQERLELYKHLDLLPRKLLLPKNEDINSLSMAGKINIIETLIQ